MKEKGMYRQDEGFDMLITNATRLGVRFCNFLLEHSRREGKTLTLFGRFRFLLLLRDAALRSGSFRHGEGVDL